MANDTQVSKTNGYAVLAPDPLASVSKTGAYAVLMPAPDRQVSSITSYAIMVPNLPEGRKSKKIMITFNGN